MKKRKNSRRIGKVAELEGASRLNRLFTTNFYRSQQNRGAIDASDLIDDDHPELSPEVKRDSSFSVKLHRAVEKARGETLPDSTAFVIHRLPGERWLLTVDLLEAPELVVKLCRLLAEFGACPKCQGSGGVWTCGKPDGELCGPDDCDRCDGSGRDPESDVEQFFQDALGNARSYQDHAESEGLDGQAIKRKRAKRKAKE